MKQRFEWNNRLRKIALTIMSVVPAVTAWANPAINEVSGNPALEKFGTAITFYASYDEGVAADLSQGEANLVAQNPTVEFKPGIRGQALLTGKTPLEYRAAENVDLSKPGALAVWISSYEWNRSEDAPVPYLTFVNIIDRGRQLLTARMGVKVNREALYVHAKAGGVSKDIVTGSSRNWKDGEWHLLVVNWRSAALEFSVDGGVVHHQEMPEFGKATGGSGHILLGAGGRYLLDEFLILNRPFNQDEIEWLYRQGKPSIRQQ